MRKADLPARTPFNVLVATGLIQVQDADRGRAGEVTKVAHANEERSRQQPMRQIDPRTAVYDGPPPRRLPETRK